MASVNKVMLIGNLGQDPELRYTPNQIAVANFSIATTDYRTDKDGKRQEFTEWHRVVVWNKQAENCAKYLSKGKPVFVEGRLQTRSWEDKTGQKRYTTEVVAQSIQFLGAPGAARDVDGARQQASQDQGHGGGGAPAQSGFGSDAPASLAGIGGDAAGLDDIPF